MSSTSSVDISSFERGEDKAERKESNNSAPLGFLSAIGDGLLINKTHPDPLS
jgi:hypothetical protein